MRRWPACGAKRSVPVMADDICFNLVHAQELVRNDCCDVISVYPGKQGGIRKAKEIVDFAAAHGVACSIGSNLELDVATAAMAHLVVACPNMQVEKYPGDMLGADYHELRVATNPGPDRRPDHHDHRRGPGWASTVRLGAGPPACMRLRGRIVTASTTASPGAIHRASVARPTARSPRGRAGCRSASAPGRCSDRPAACGPGRTGAAAWPGSRWG